MDSRMYFLVLFGLHYVIFSVAKPLYLSSRFLKLPACPTSTPVTRLRFFVLRTLITTTYCLNLPQDCFCNPQTESCYVY
jgi:hypothetical protein